MDSAPRLFAALGAANGFLAVAFGAFGAHALRARLAPAMLDVYHTGSQYHFYHALALVAVALLAVHLPGSAAIRAAGWSFTAGIVLFSGSLYLLAVTGTRWLGAITPLGGLAFLLGWALMLVGVVRR